MTPAGVIVSGGIDLSVGSTAALAMQSLSHGRHGEAMVLIVGTLVCAGVGIGVGLIEAPVSPCHPLGTPA